MNRTNVSTLTLIISWLENCHCIKDNYIKYENLETHFIINVTYLHIEISQIENASATRHTIFLKSLQYNILKVLDWLTEHLKT